MPGDCKEPWISWSCPNIHHGYTWHPSPCHFECRYVLHQFPPKVHEMQQLCSCGTCVYNDSSPYCGCILISTSRIILWRWSHYFPDCLGCFYHGDYCTSKVLPNRHFIIYWSNHEDGEDPDDIHSLSVYGVTDDDIWSFLKELFAHVFDNGAGLYFCGLDYSSGTNCPLSISASILSQVIKLPHQSSVSLTNIHFDTVCCGQLLGVVHGCLMFEDCIFDSEVCDAFVEASITNRTMTGLIL